MVPGTVKATISGLAAATLQGLFPQYCSLCGLQSLREQPLCCSCESDLPRNELCCWRCALPLGQFHHETAQRQKPGYPSQRTLCGQCLQSPPGFDQVLAPWLYDEQIAFLLHRWKFHGDRKLSALLAHLWLSQWPPSSAVPDIMLPIPLHWTKLLRRGFNQSQCLAVELRRQSRSLKDVNIDTHLLQRHRATSAQSGLAAHQRRANVRGAFTARRRCDNLRIAIVDDVLTTGATAAAVATTLRDAGANHIEIWCLARTPEPRN